jgi:ArsR family transcriptional regulator
MNKTERQNLSLYMKALGHPVRVQIIEILGREGECFSGDLSSQLPVAASTTSQHLSILKDAGLISGAVDGPRRCYCVNKQAFDEARQLLSGLRGCC